MHACPYVYLCLCAVVLSVAGDNCSFDLCLNVVDYQLANTNPLAAWWAFVCSTNQSRSVYVLGSQLWRIVHTLI